jgi:hypothetical protein
MKYNEDQKFYIYTYRENHPEKCKEISKNYYLRHREQILQKKKERYWQKKGSVRQGNLLENF